MVGQPLVMRMTQVKCQVAPPLLQCIHLLVTTSSLHLQVKTLQLLWNPNLQTLVNPLYLHRPFPSCPEPLFQSEAKCEAIDMKMNFIVKQIKLIFTRKVMHLTSFWKWDFLDFGNGLLHWNCYLYLCHRTFFGLSWSALQLFVPWVSIKFFDKYFLRRGVPGLHCWYIDYSELFIKFIAQEYLFLNFWKTQLTCMTNIRIRITMFYGLSKHSELIYGSLFIIRFRFRFRFRYRLRAILSH